MNKLLLSLLARQYRAEETGEPEAGGGVGEESLDDGNDWASMLEEEPVVEGEFDTEGDETETPEVKHEPEEKVEAGDKPEEGVTPEVKPETVPEVQKEETTPVQQAETPPTEFNWEKWEEESIKAVEKDYVLDEEDAQAMITEPETVLPKLAARVHVAVVKNILAHLPSILPQILEGVQAQQKAQETNENLFFGVNEDLKDPQFYEAIRLAGQQYRSINPNANADAVAFNVGNMVRLLKGLPLRQEAKADAQISQQTPTAQPRATKQFIPATGGGTSQAPTTSGNDFELFAEEMLKDD